MQTNEALTDYQRLSIAFVNALDHREYDRVAPLFTEKGVFDRMGQSFEGREAIKKWLHSRPEQLTMRHILTNFELTPIADDELRGVTISPCTVSWKLVMVRFPSPDRTPSANIAMSSSGRVALG
jgi:hypothetical protein